MKKIGKINQLNEIRSAVPLTTVNSFLKFHKRLNLSLLQRIIVLFVIFLSQTISVVAQKGSYVNLSLSTNKIIAGEVFMLSISSNIAGQIKIDLPKEFIKAGVMSERSSDALINNRVVSQIEISQGYYCERKGNYTVGPAEINGVKSKSTSIQVVGDDSKTIAGKFHDNLNSAPVFGQITCSKKSVYLGEAFVVDSKIYSRYSVAGIDNNYTLSKAKGNLELFSLQDPRKYNSGQLNIQGVPHIYIDFAKQLCFANKTGKAGLSPFSGNIQIDKGFFPETVYAQSNALEIDVIPLPSNAPDSYSGLVGSFTYRFNPTHQLVAQGEIIKLYVAVNGTGNLQVANAPHLKLPDGFEIYGEIDRKEEIQYTEDGVSGLVGFTYHLLATKPGKFIFETQRFTYFDLPSKSYISTFSEPVKFHVTSDPNYVKKSNQLKLEKYAPSQLFSIIRIIGPIVLLLIILYGYFRWKKTKGDSLNISPKNSTKPIEDSKKTEPITNAQSSPKETQSVTIPASVSTMEGTPLYTLLYELIIKQLKNVCELEYASSGELLTALSDIPKFNYLVPKINVLLDELNQLRYGGKSLANKEDSDVIVHKAAVVLRELA